MVGKALHELRRGERWGDLVEALTLRVASAGPHDAVSDYNELGEIMLKQFGNEAEAMRFFEASLAIDHEQPNVERRLRMLYEKRRDSNALSRLEQIARRRTSREES